MTPSVATHRLPNAIGYGKSEMKQNTQNSDFVGKSQPKHNAQVHVTHYELT